MLRLRSKNALVAFAAFLSSACFAQTAVDLESKPVLRVAEKLACSCGCKMNMSCQMEGPCGTCKRFKSQIWQMQQTGKTDDQILASIVQENGRDILAIPPGTIGSVLSYSGLAVGALLVYWFIRRRQVPAPASAAVQPPDPLLQRYHAQIEKETASLDE